MGRTNLLLINTLRQKFSKEIITIISGTAVMNWPTYCLQCAFEMEISFLFLQFCNF